MSSNSENITELLSKVKTGDEHAAARLIEVVYPELRRLAASYMRRERPGHTLQATALVNEAFVRLAGQSIDWQDRAHFFGVAAHLMRQVLVEYARSRKALKRGAGGPKLALDDVLMVSEAQSTELLALDEALARLAAIDERQSRIVELRYFGGLTVEETAAALGISEKTVKRDWSLARAWLHREIFA